MAPTGYKPGPVSAVPPDARPAAKPAKAPAKPAPVKKAPTLSPVDQAVNRLGTPLTDAQIQANAQGQLAPLIKQLTDSIGRQAQTGTQAIGGYTGELAKQLGGFQANAKDIYGGAQSAQAASDAALSQKLTGEGGQQAQALGSQLASVNAPGATNAAVQDATATAGGAGNALYAIGSASLANLIASGAAEQSYASKLPGIADLSGIQQTGQLQSSLAKSLADQTGTLQAKVPDIVAGLQTDRQNLRGNRETLRQNLDSAAASEAAKQQALKQERQALGLPDASLSRAYGYAVNKAGNPVGGGQAQPLPGYHTTPGGGVAKDVKPSKGTAAATPSSSITHAINDGYLYDGNGNRVTRNGQPVKAPKTGTGSTAAKSLTVPQKEKATADAYGIARNALAGKDGKGNKAPKLNVGQAWDQMKLHGLLADPRTKAIAVKALIQTYGSAGARFVKKQGLVGP